MTNSNKSLSEKLAAGRGRETAAKKPHNKKAPGPHHSRNMNTCYIFFHLLVVWWQVWLAR
jgi:hypothetical protein